MIQRLLPVLFSCMLLAGCVMPGSRTAPPRVFDLVSTVPTAAIADPRPAQLIVAEPRAEQMLDSVRIAVRPQPGELRYYARAAWRDPAPRLVHDVVLRAFEDAGAFRAVGRAGAGLRGDLQLTLELRRFEAAYPDPDGNPEAVIELQATLLQGASGRALASTRLSARQPVDGVEIAEVVRAMSLATDEVVTELVQWAHQAAAQAE